MGILRRDVVALQITYIWSVFTEYVLYVRESDEGPLLRAPRPMTGTSLRLTDFMVSTSYPRVARTNNFESWATFPGPLMDMKLKRKTSFRYIYLRLASL